MTRISPRDFDLYEGLAGTLLDLESGDGRCDQAYQQLADELLRNGPRRWVTPDHGSVTSEGVAVQRWLDHVRSLREERDRAKRAAFFARYVATVDPDDKVRVYEDGVWVRSGWWSHGDIVDCPISLPDEVWEHLVNTIRRVN